ncbi:MAG: hypothetical protein ACYC5O_16505 [Anaerolineae bacterium]
MPQARPLILVLAPAEVATLLTALLDESGYLPTVVTDVAAATNALSERTAAAALAWVRPGDAGSLASLRALADRTRGVPLLAVVGPEGAAMRGALTQFGARATILLVEDSDQESLAPLREVLEARAREEKRRRPGHAIP